MTSESSLIASVIIPARNRAELTQRAVNSVLAQKGSSKVEIIVVDDASEDPLAISSLRVQDRLLRNATQRGAAVSRNRGMDCARGEIIYLLDSDDEFIERNFEEDHRLLSENPGLYYSQIVSGSYTSNFKRALSATTYLSDIFGRQKFIAQTSSLSFPASLELRFDEGLPKHQDWDFVFTALRAGVPVRHGAGSVHFDRTDTGSLSRSASSGRSAAWIAKLREIERSSPPLEFSADVIESFLTNNVFNRRSLINIPAIKVLASPKITAASKLKFIAKALIQSK